MHLALTSLNPRGKAVIKPLSPEYREQLAEIFLEAFSGAPEYADYDLSHFKKTGTEYFERFFGPTRGEWSPTSVVAYYRRQIAGAVAIKKRTNGEHVLDCLFVRLQAQGRGLARAMVDNVVNQLLEQGVGQLRSYVMLANEKSLAWHKGYGFVELPDFWVASHRCAYYHWELERNDQLHHLSTAEFQQFEQLAKYWWSERQRLEELWLNEIRARRQDLE